MALAADTSVMESIKKRMIAIKGRRTPQTSFTIDK